MYSQRKKISILIYSLAGGGAERVVCQLVPYLEDKNLEVILVLMNSTNDYNFKPINSVYLLEDSKASENNILKFLKLPLLAWRYHLFMKENDIKTSVSFLTRPAYISILTKLFFLKRRIIISERSNPSSQYKKNDSFSTINRFLIKWLYPKADLIITNSLGAKFDLKFNFKINEKLIITIYNPIDLERINQIQANQLFYDKNFFNIITVGRLDKGKNHSLLIRTMDLLRDKKIRLYIFGNGVLLDELKQLIEFYNLQKSVFTMGFDNNPYQYLKAADLFVFSSNHEGFPNVVLEALACKLPIVSTNCPFGPNEIMKVPNKFSCSLNIHTDFGILTPLDDVNSFFEGISFMHDNPGFRINCSINAGERAKDFRKEFILNQFFSLLN